MRKLFAVAFVAVLLVSACKKSTTVASPEVPAVGSSSEATASEGPATGPSPVGGGGTLGSGACANPYYPVVQGDTWNYLSTSNVTGHTSYSDTITSVANGGFTVASKYTGLTKTAEWQCTSEGLVALSYGGGPSAAIQTSSSNFAFKTSNVTGVTIPADPQPGDTWQQSFDIAGTNTIAGTSTAAKGTFTTANKAVGMEQVTVPGGSFNALKVATTSKMNLKVDVSGVSESITMTFESSEWYAPGVGMVQTIGKGRFMGSSISSKIQLKSDQLK